MLFAPLLECEECVECEMDRQISCPSLVRYQACVHVETDTDSFEEVKDLMLIQLLLGNMWDGSSMTVQTCKQYITVQNRWRLRKLYLKNYLIEQHYFFLSENSNIGGNTSNINTISRDFMYVNVFV